METLRIKPVCNIMDMFSSVKIAKKYAMGL